MGGKIVQLNQSGPYASSIKACSHVSNILFKKYKSFFHQVFYALDRIGESNYKSRTVRTDKWKYIKNYNRDKSINELATAYRQAMQPIFHLLNIYNEKGLLTPEQEALVRLMPEELYNLENDPFEINNLVGEGNHLDKPKELKSKLEACQTIYPDFGMQEDSEELKKAFAQYGVKSGPKYKYKIDALERVIKEKIDKLK